MSNAIDKPVLIIHEGEKAGQRWIIRDPELIVGRGGECDLVLPERQVSREHIRIYRANDLYYLEDLDSKNGTWVNGKQVKALRRAGDLHRRQLQPAFRCGCIRQGCAGDPRRG